MGPTRSESQCQPSFLLVSFCGLGKQMACMFDVEHSTDALFKTSALASLKSRRTKCIPIGPKYPMNRASFQFLHTRGMSLYRSSMLGMRRSRRTRNPSRTSRGYVIPVISGWLNSSHGNIAPMYMNPPKFRRTSIQGLTSSCRVSVSARNDPSQLSALPAAKHARRSLVPMHPHVPIIKSCIRLSDPKSSTPGGTRTYPQSCRVEEIAFRINPFPVTC